jgi:hypothetical protein
MNSFKEKTNGSNLPNLVRIKAIGLKNVKKVRLNKLPNSHTLEYWPVRVINDSSFFEIRTVPGACNFFERKITSNGGTSFEGTIEFFLPSDSTNIRDELVSNLEEMYILAIEDSEGQKRLVGTEKNPLRLIHDFKTADEKGYKFQFVGETINPAYFLQSIQNEMLASAANDLEAALPNS